MGSVNSVDMVELDELRKIIIDRLTGGVHPEDITLEICERSGLAWAEAQSIVEKVQEESVEIVAKQQFPLISAISIVFSIAGLAMALLGAIGLITLALDYRNGVTIPEHIYPAQNAPQWINTAIEQMGMGIKLFQLQFISGYVEFLVIGIFLMIGGYVSMHRSLNPVIDELISWMNNR
jgi:hypothetical protein